MEKQLRTDFKKIIDSSNFSEKEIAVKEKYLNKLYETGQTDLIKYLENAEYNETDMWKMLRHIKRRDRLRGTNLLEVFPEWKEYYETCNG